jgi:hypothetical protein
MLVIKWPIESQCRLFSFAIFLLETLNDCPASPGFAKEKKKLTGLLGGTANGSVIVVQDNADLIHQPDLFVIVALQISC